MDKNYTVLSIGAGFPQEEFVDALKARNMRVISIGKGRNSQKVIDNSDIFAEVDTHSFADLDQWIQANNVQFDTAGSFAGGGAILTLQKINEKYNLPTRIPSELMVGMDKFSQQALYEKYELTTIKSWTTLEVKDANIDGIKKFVLKPAVGRGSAGVEFVCNSELKERIASNSIPEDYIVQEFREGVEYRMLMIVQTGEIKLLAPVKRESYEGTSFLGRLSYSATHLDRIQVYCEGLVKKLKIENSIIKFDILVSENNVDMIEMDIAVGGGIYFKRFIESLFEWDIINRYIDLISGVHFESASIQNPRYVMDYVYNHTGKPFEIVEEEVENYLKTIIDGNFKVIYNKLKPWEHGLMSSNAHFIFTIIHDECEYSDKQLNDLINQNVFLKWVK